MHQQKISRRALLAGAAAAWPGPAVAAPVVELALVLAIDCSYSVTPEEYQLQMRGTGQAFLAPEILQAVAGSLRRQLAISAFVWSSPENRFVLVPWQLLKTAADAEAIARIFLRAPRDLPRETTATGAALLFAQQLLETAPRALRHVVDVSTDGECNDGPKVEAVRDQLLAKGTVINGLAITKEVPDLVDYLHASVIGGDRSFVMQANDFEAYGHTLREKLFREISNVDLI